MVNLDNCTIHLLEKISCTTEEELLEHEDRYIEQFKEEGKTLRNVKTNIKKEKTIKAPEIKIEQLDLREKYKIVDQEEKKQFRIFWHEDKKPKNVWLCQVWEKGR